MGGAGSLRPSSCLTLRQNQTTERECPSPSQAEELPLEEGQDHAGLQRQVQREDRKLRVEQTLRKILWQIKPNPKNTKTLEEYKVTQ